MKEKPQNLIVSVAKAILAFFALVIGSVLIFVLFIQPIPTHGANSAWILQFGFRQAYCSSGSWPKTAREGLKWLRKVDADIVRRDLDRDDFSIDVIVRSPKVCTLRYTAPSIFRRAVGEYTIDVSKEPCTDDDKTGPLKD